MDGDLKQALAEARRLSSLISPEGTPEKKSSNYNKYNVNEQIDSKDKLYFSRGKSLIKAKPWIYNFDDQALKSKEQTFGRSERSKLRIMRFDKKKGKVVQEDEVVVEKFDIESKGFSEVLSPEKPES